MTLYYYEEMTMKEIGLTLGVVESRVSQIHAFRGCCICAASWAHFAAVSTRTVLRTTGIRKMPSVDVLVVYVLAAAFSIAAEVDEGRVMDKTLKQDEIDALFQAARAEKTAPGTAGVADVVGQQPQQGSALQLFPRRGRSAMSRCAPSACLNDIFARNLTHNLGAWLRSTFEVTLVSAEQIPFSQFIARIPELSYVCSVRLEPLRAVSVLQMEMAPAPAIIDLLLGGPGSAGQQRELTGHRGVNPCLCRRSHLPRIERGPGSR